MREPVDAELDELISIAAAGGSPDADRSFLQFVRDHGRLLVADAGGAPAGFAGAIPIGDVLMVTDLFVDVGHRGRGIGGSLLGAVLRGAARRMTFSSTHPAALAAYTTAGMALRCKLLTMRRERGGDATSVQPMLDEDWRHERPELVAYFRSRGAHVSRDHVVMVETYRSVVLRALGDPYEAVLIRALAELPRDRPVDVSVGEHHPCGPWLRSCGFEVIDHDLFFAGPGIELPPAGPLLHRGLA